MADLLSLTVAHCMHFLCCFFSHIFTHTLQYNPFPYTDIDIISTQIQIQTLHRLTLWNYILKNPESNIKPTMPPFKYLHLQPQNTQ